MRERHRLLLVAVGVMLSPGLLLAQEAVRWQPTLENARRLAAQDNRLVLVHFWADWCVACRQMERDVFSQPEVILAIQTNYVPVKINADYFPATRQLYGVTALPVDVIVNPQGQLVDRIQGAATAGEYVAQLRRVAMSAKSQVVGAAVAQGPGSQPPAVAPRSGATAQGPAGAKPTDDRYADYFQAQAPSGGASSMQGPANPGGPPLRSAEGPSVPPRQPGVPSQFAGFQPPAAAPQTPGQIPAGNPPLGLDGYCPVELAEKSQWVLGNPLWGARHRGRTYLFAGPEQQRRFLAAPDQYAPILSGHDVVLAIDQGKTVPGYRQHGVFFGNRVYLFADEVSLAKFSGNPNYYANQALQATVAGAMLAPRVR